MGISILELVLRRLREANFTADIAYPGQKYPKVDKTVAAVHIQKVDRANMTVTVEVNIICPASMGGTTCELEALRATEILRWSRAVCVQNGCTYDGVAQVYVVAVLATFTCVTEADKCSLGPGFCGAERRAEGVDAAQRRGRFRGGRYRVPGGVCHGGVRAGGYQPGADAVAHSAGGAAACRNGRDGGPARGV